MKPKFLDKRNCHALLPPGHGLPMMQQLDNCLHQINNKPGQYQGLISKLIKQNKNIFNSVHGSERELLLAQSSD